MIRAQRDMILMDSGGGGISHGSTADKAIHILKTYAEENGSLPRATTDLSPLEEWLIVQLIETTWSPSFPAITTAIEFLKYYDVCMNTDRTHQEQMENSERGKFLFERLGRKSTHDENLFRKALLRAIMELEFVQQNMVACPEPPVINEEEARLLDFIRCWREANAGTENAMLLAEKEDQS